MTALIGLIKPDIFYKTVLEIGDNAKTQLKRNEINKLTLVDPKELRAFLPDENSPLKPGDVYLPSKAFNEFESNLDPHVARAKAFDRRKFLMDNLQIWSGKN